MRADYPIAPRGVPDRSGDELCGVRAYCGAGGCGGGYRWEQCDLVDHFDDLDHQLTLGSEFVFSIDGRGGAPTTAIIAKLGDGLYRADIASDPNGNYDADAILFLGEQVATIHYHAIIVSAEATNNRQPVAERIRNSGLRGANLSSIDFSWLDLSGASIEGCNLQSAEFANAQLHGAELIDCDLSYANFSSAKLTGALLRGSNLSQAYFGYASMQEIDLSLCNLASAVLKSADLTRANFSGAICLGAYFSGATIRNIRGATLESLGLLN